MEILTNLPCGNVGQSMTTSCDRVPGPAKKPQEVLTSDSVTPTVTVTFRSRCDGIHSFQIHQPPRICVSTLGAGTLVYGMVCTVVAINCQIGRVSQSSFCPCKR
uniref:Uncharacterized protein n=1 Tax=Magallana gigas TaxID=29159 RepID=K1PCM3_MAGGI